MGILNFLKKKKAIARQIPGPGYLDNLAEVIIADDVLKHEWRGRLKSPSGQTKFKIKFYGKLHSHYNNLIVGTDFAPLLVYAADPETGEEILVFDGCKYGYNALFCDTYSKDQNGNRPVDSTYSAKGDSVFEIIISVYNVVYFDNELAGSADSDGFVELADGSKQSLFDASRNAFDTLSVYAINEKGERFMIISEELA